MNNAFSNGSSVNHLLSVVMTYNLRSILETCDGLWLHKVRGRGWLQGRVAQGARENKYGNHSTRSDGSEERWSCLNITGLVR